MNKNLIYVGTGSTSEPGGMMAPIQMQAVAQRNGLDSHQNDGYQDMTGLTVTLDDLRTADTHGRHGLRHYVPQLEAMAARVGAVVQHPGDKLSESSYFVYPTVRQITPHKGGRTVKKSTDMTPEVAEMLAKLDISLGDLVEDAVRSRYAQMVQS